MDALIIKVYFVYLRVFEPSPKGIPMGVVINKPVFATPRRDPYGKDTRSHEEFLLHLFKIN